MPDAVRFTLDDAHRANDEWGANCGPGALAAITGLTLDEIRPHMGDFERKGYTNPTLMFSALASLRARYRATMAGRMRVPDYGLARVQWEGPWTAPGVPIRVRYRHSHWIGARTLPVEPLGADLVEVFDINCMSVGGWVPYREWTDKVVPWLLNLCEPKADGRWHLTHSIEIERERADA